MMAAGPRLCGLAVAGMMFAALASNPSGAEETFDPSADGWHSWSVPAPPGAVARCCHCWSGLGASHAGCELDGVDGSYSGDAGAAGDFGHTRLYVLVKSGRPERIVARSPACPLRTESAVTEHGPVDPDASVDWLRRFVAADSRVGSEALAALSLHGGDRALRTLVGIVESGAEGQLREEALFWLIQSGSDAGFAYIDGLLTAD